MPNPSRTSPLRPLAWIATLPLAALLVACGGGGGDANTENSAVSAGSLTLADNNGGSIPALAAADCGLPDFQAELLRQVNALRATGAVCGIDADGVDHGSFGPSTPLAWNAKLTAAAAAHSGDMAANNYFSHTSLDKRNVGDRVAAAGYDWGRAAENIAAGQTTVNSVMSGWTKSPGHCANLLDPALRDIGVACVPGTSGNKFGTYWTMDLGTLR